MIMFRIIPFLFLVILYLNVNAQPHIKGTVEIDMELGLIQCDFELSKIPNIHNYHILLNKGMNIKNFKNNRGRLLQYDGHYNGQIQGEGIAYVLKTEFKHIPASFHISYRGAFPVYNHEFAPFDYKGIIAFNGETLRAAEQSKWYPVIHDLDNDRLFDRYTYDINISMKGGHSMFLNGTPPIKSNKSNFKSKKAYPLLLFTGNYNFIENNGDYILNTKVSNEISENVFKNIALIKHNYARRLKKEFTDPIYVINHRAINQRKEGSSWGFNTYPSFAFTNLSFDDMLDDKGSFTNDTFRYFGHEFAHNYFGNNVVSGTLSWFWLESFAEYLSLTIAEDFSGKEYLKEVLMDKVHGIKKEDNFVPLSKIKKRDEINPKYRYDLAPMMLQCFEDRFGRDKMNQTIEQLLEYAEQEALTLEIWKACANASGISLSELEEFEKKFISGTNFKNNIINQICTSYGIDAKNPH